MRIEAAGAQITDAVVEVLDNLQNDRDLTESYLKTLDEITRSVILDLSAIDGETDSRTIARIRILQMIWRDILTLSTPPDADDPANDVPVASF
jgi:hypothetical protein